MSVCFPKNSKKMRAKKMVIIGYDFHCDQQHFFLEKQLCNMQSEEELLESKISYVAKDPYMLKTLMF